MRKTVNITLEPEVYQGAKKILPNGEISSFINDFLKEHIKKQQKERLIASYKKTAKSKAIKEEDKIWEDTIADGMEKK